MICQVCKRPDNWCEYQISGKICICSDCKKRFSNSILLVCQICDAMIFIAKTPDNIKRLQYFMNASLSHFLMLDVIIPMNGCPHCVTFENSFLGELKLEVKETL